MKWISVEDELPGKGAAAICYDYEIFIGYNYGNSYWDDVEFSRRDVTHWMPLPDPPN